MAIIFETQLDFEDAVMQVLKDRLAAEVVVTVQNYYNNPSVIVELDINDKDEDGVGLLARATGQDSA